MPQNVMNIMLAVFILNVLGYLIMHIDKNNSRNGRRRISEASLLALAAIGGSLGVFVAMRALHHKTRKKKFKWGVPAIIIVQILLVLVYSIKFI